MHWSFAFLSLLVKDVHFVGTTIQSLPPNVLGGEGPRVEGMAWAITSLGLRIAVMENVFTCHMTKEKSIIDGQWGLGRAILKHNLDMESLLLKYGEKDWRNKHHWNCNNRQFTRGQGN